MKPQNPTQPPSRPASRTTGPAPHQASPPHWEVQTDRNGYLVATLTGTFPPLTVTGHDLETLRKQIKTVIMRAML